MYVDINKGGLIMSPPLLVIRMLSLLALAIV